ncbi:MULTISPECIES: sulfite exporter TauE/SafE family protein [Pseudovibrio]|uniref:sulfite exporter TauE/SafE family protein n=1 Tax=Stappiaceae TaxID=2821832 RepID=UPI002365FA63|nr:MULTISPECIES: sulfite exporter TauE/SafE family protein [Pseudovibrio]MDD7909069.1 sulfite exporter TauE/SafE family protein [Pseudovibrio exalbescens]MDX5593610.1 sulfite exporter TauE/SafE family protein [Pseudovibrio sp. SPO723]
MDHFSAELLPLVGALLAAGGLAGFMAGLFGIGGGAILVPVLLSVLVPAGVDPSIAMHVSVATSLAVIVPTSLRSFFAHNARGAVDHQLLKSWLVAVPAGGVIAAWVASWISGDGLKAIFMITAFFVAMRMLFNKESWRLGDDVPGNPLRAFIGMCIGFFSTLMGIGGGVMTNTFMTLFNRPIHQAVATSSGVGVLISIPGVLGMIAAGWGQGDLPPLSLGYVNLLAVAIIIPLSIFMAPIGARVAHYMKRRHLEVAFGIFLLFVCARFAFSLI